MEYASERTPGRQNGLESPFLTICRPAAHEGVGQALRQAFQAQRDSMPADLTALLDRLDKY